MKTVQRVGQQSEEIKSLKKQYTILLHKKQRTEGERYYNEKFLKIKILCEDVSIGIILEYDLFVFR